MTWPGGPCIIIFGLKIPDELVKLRGLGQDGLNKVFQLLLLCMHAYMVGVGYRIDDWDWLYVELGPSRKHAATSAFGTDVFFYCLRWQPLINSIHEGMK